MSDLYKIHNGEPVITNKGVALLLGVTEEQIKSLPITNGSTKIPELWVKKGRRIMRETAASIGTDSMREALDYLDKQHGRHQ